MTYDIDVSRLTQTKRGSRLDRPINLNDEGRRVQFRWFWAENESDKHQWPVEVRLSGDSAYVSFKPSAQTMLSTFYFEYVHYWAFEAANMTRRSGRPLIEPPRLVYQTESFDIVRTVDTSVLYEIDFMTMTQRHRGTGKVRAILLQVIRVNAGNAEADAPSEGPLASISQLRLRAGGFVTLTAPPPGETPPSRGWVYGVNLVPDDDDDLKNEGWFPRDRIERADPRDIPIKVRQIVPPATWTTPTYAIRLVDLDPVKDATEWKAVLKPDETGQFVVHGIARVQNFSLWRKFKTSQMDVQADKLERVFHGTSSAAVDDILDRGFDPTINPDPGNLGRGSYFAASLAEAFRFAVSDDGGAVASVFLCNLAVNPKRVIVGDRNLIKPLHQYDFFVNDDGDEFCMPKPDFAYPLYLLRLGLTK